MIVRTPTRRLVLQLAEMWLVSGIDFEAKFLLGGGFPHLYLEVEPA